VTVLRDGAVVLSCPVAETDHDTMVNAMVGRTAESTLAVHEARVKKVMDSGVAPIISVRELAGAGIEDVSFDVRPGEILGFAGIVGSGASEVGRMVTGAEPTTGGTIAVAGRDAPRRWTPRAAMSAGIAFVPQDRHAEGGVLTLSLRDNVSLPRYSEYWRKAGAERADVEGVITDLDVQPPLADKPFAEFSGGNQQKALLGKWLLLDPKVLVLDDPTYGVDPNAREILLHAVAEVADRGAAVIVISTEPEQLARICDRVLVMRSGRISTELTDDNINEVEISLACFS
jgi:ribose transport system ATP-binding protein